MKLPIAFFYVKLIGDIMQRIGDHKRIKSFLTGSLINIIFAVITLVVYTVVMATYHVGILGIFFIGSILYIGWVVLFLKRRRELDYKRFQQALDYIFRWYTATKDEKRAMLKSLSDAIPEIREIAESTKELFEKLKIPGTPTVYINN